MKKELFQRLKNLLNPNQDGVNDETVNTYNQTVEQLETDYQKQISVLEETHLQKLSTLESDYKKQLEDSQGQIATFQQQFSGLNDQIATLQDQLKASPTIVDASDPQVKIGHAEEAFGKQLLKDMPAHLKDKFKKS